jgi:phosphatidylserine decarboxylase
MKHEGEARRAALKIILWTLLGICALAITGLIAKFLSVLLVVLASGLIFLWVLFALFTLYFFRDPTPKTPIGPGLVVSPGHGKVDVVDHLKMSEFMAGPCHRISIFLSVINVHVQNAPISGTVTSIVHTEGEFISALKLDCADCNENVLIGFASTETPGEKVGLRLIAGLIARRIVPFVKVGELVPRGERISLIQFGSRCDLYLPLSYKIKTKLGDNVVGGETILATK